jgi:RND family efflux transporter MFP subunit
MDHQKKHSRSRLLFLIVVAIVVTGGTTGYLAFRSHSSNQKETKERKTQQEAGQKVETSIVKQSETERTLLLVGEARPYYSVTLYARVSGYMDQLNADIGDQVKKGQILAHVESPEQEQAYNSAAANLFNLRRIADRMKILRSRNLISQQQKEQAVSQADIAEANLRTQRVMRGYQNVVAPFDGIISNRFVDPGWLLQNASGSQSASQPLFTLSKIDELRLFVYVDQKDAPFVHVGDPVEIQVPNSTEVHQASKVEMIAGELDPKTRTLLVEMILPNPHQTIVAGSFVQVQMKVKTPSFLELPVQALIMSKNEPYVPVVQNDGKIEYTKIQLVENDGERILIRGGVKPGEKVALNIGSTLTDQQKVQPLNGGAEGTGVAQKQNESGQHQMSGTAIELTDKSPLQLQNQLQQPQPKAKGGSNQ